MLLCKFFGALPLLFILFVLIADKISMHYRKQHFTFIHRGDMVSVNRMDTLISIVLFLGPLLLAVVSRLLALKFHYELPDEYFIRLMASY